MLLSATQIIIGLALLIWPHPLIERARRNRAKRLDALKDGAEEAFFEERRSLEATYPVAISPWLLRMVGFLSVGLGVVHALGK